MDSEFKELRIVPYVVSVRYYYYEGIMGNEVGKVVRS